MKTGFETDTHGWLTLILAEWERIRSRVPALASLRAPNFRISDELVSTLGLWDQTRRTITLARPLLDGAQWHLLVKVLAHEMAHQVVSEYFGVRQTKPHDALFRRACDLLGIDTAARIDAPGLGQPAPESRIYQTIRKLLALGQSANRFEAESALRKAHYLALKYNVDLLAREVPAGYEYRLVGTARRRVPSYTWLVTQICCDNYFVLYICRACNGLQVIEFYGTRDNLDLAEYVFDFLLHQGGIEWVAYKREHGLPNNRQQRSFLTGLYSGFIEKLDSQRAELASDKSLIWLGDPQLQSFYQQRNPRVVNSRSRAAHHVDAHSAGARVGAELSIRPGLKRGGRSIRGLIE